MPRKMARHSLAEACRLLSRALADVGKRPYRQRGSTCGGIVTTTLSRDYAVTDDKTKITAQDAKLIGLSEACASQVKKFCVNGRRLADAVRRDSASVSFSRAAIGER
jgi:hypothetical protein